MKQNSLMALCQRHHAVLLASDEQMLSIAVVGNPSPELMQALRFATQKRIDIECWDRQRMEQHRSREAQTHLPAAREENDSVVDVLNQVLQRARQQRASDIHFEPTEDNLRVRLRIDGVLHPYSELPAAMSASLVARLKVLGGLDIAERRLPQDGQFSVELSDSTTSFRIATLPCRHGEKVVLRLLQQAAQTLNLSTLGMTPEQLGAFNNALRQPQGLMLVTGPTGSGKTVTLYSALQARNTPEVNICSVEDPIEIPLTGVNQTQINPRSGLNFQSVLRALLRQDPDIVMVGEIRDAETAEIALNAAQTGHLVLSTLHTNSTCETLVRLQQMGVARWITSSALLLVVAQRLVRRLCPHCRQQNGSHAALPRALWPRALPRWRTTGCPRCYGGYLGRIALFEVLVITDDIRQIIASGVDAGTLARMARQTNMMTLFEHGCLAVERGETSQEELLRVLGIPHGE